jgi:hypothetical protein
MSASLENVLVPPAKLPASIDWPSVERDLGNELPEDYKSFVARYGAGSIDGFLSVFTPSGPTQWVDLVWRSCDHPELFVFRAEDHPAFPAFPAKGGLLPFGQTDNGDRLYWRTDGAPSAWTVLVLEGRGPERFEFKGSMSLFLENVLSRRVRVNVFPDDFPSTNPAFEPYDN